MFASAVYLIYTSQRCGLKTHAYLISSLKSLPRIIPGFVVGLKFITQGAIGGNTECYFFPIWSIFTYEILLTVYVHASWLLFNGKTKCYACVCASAFVKSDRPDAFPGLKIRYMRGLDPQLVLLDDNKQAVETLGIEKWDTDTMEEFLQEQLSK